MENLKFCAVIFIVGIILGSIFLNFQGIAESVFAANGSIMMTDYFPVANMSLLYRTANGNVYLKHVIEKTDPRASLVNDKPGSTHYVIHDYLSQIMDNNDSTKVLYGNYNLGEAPYYSDTWHMRNGPDGEVSEVADSYAKTDRSGNPHECQAPCLGRMALYKEQVIGHGQPGGDAVGETPYLQNSIHVWYSPDPDSQPFTYRSDMNVWSSLQVIDRLDVYTPEFGNKDDVFQRGGGKTYNNVIVAYFGHGSTVDPSKEPFCANMPSGLNHVQGYSSFWQKVWLAPGVGWIKIENLFYEPSCGGTLAPIASAPADAWIAYLDKITVDDKAVDFTQSIVNSCAEVGYPAGFTGYYKSTRQCVAGQWTDWSREDLCKFESGRVASVLPQSVNPTKNCVVSCTPKTCASLGNGACGSASDGCGGTLDCGECVSFCPNGSCLDAISSQNKADGVAAAPAIVATPQEPSTPIVPQMSQSQILAAIAQIQALIGELQKQLVEITGTVATNPLIR